MSDPNLTPNPPPAGWETLNPAHHLRTSMAEGSMERPWVSPGRPPWAGQYVVQAQPQPSSTLAVWALITGVVGVLAGWCLLGLPCVAAVILGHLAVNQTKDGRITGRGMAVAGLVLGYVALIPAVILTFWFIASVAGGGAASVVPTATY
jgi:hypothetical protein